MASVQRITSLGTHGRRIEAAANDRWWMLLIPLFLLSFWLGARSLTVDVVWADEIYSIRDAGGPFFGPLDLAGNWRRVATGNPWHVPGFFMLLNGWGRLVSWDAPALRLFALLLGMPALAWSYRLARDLTTPRTAVYATVLLGTTGFFTYYLHEIRMYTLIVLLASYTLWLYLRILSARRVTALMWLGLLVGAVSILYTHYLAGLVLVTIGVYHGLVGLSKLRKRDSFSWRRWWAVVAVMLAAGLLFVPWLGALRDGLARNAADVQLQERVLTADQIVERVAFLFSNGNPVLLAIMLVVSLIALWQTRRGRRVWLLTLILFSVILLVNAVLSIIPLTRLRYLLSLYPLLATLVALGFVQIEQGWSRRWLAYGLLLVWVATGVYRSVDLSFSESDTSKKFIFPMHMFSDDMRQLAQPGDLVVAYLPDDTEAWVYQTMLRIGNYYFDGFTANYRVTMTLYEPDERAADLQLLVDQLPGRERVFTAHMPATNPAALRDFESVLQRDFDLCSSPIQRGDLTVDLFTRSPVCCPATAAASDPLITYGGDAVTLTAAEPPGTFGDTLSVLIGWSVGAEVLPHRYSVALHILDKTGALVTQADYALPFAAHACTPTSVDIAALPPGTYTLHVIVYAWETGDRLTGTHHGTGETGDRLSLGQFVIGE